MALLGKPMLNMTTFLNLAAPVLLQRKLDQLNLTHAPGAEFEFRNAQIIYKARGEAVT
jgi:hypothetical protein